MVWTAVCREVVAYSRTYVGIKILVVVQVDVGPASAFVQVDCRAVGTQGIGRAGVEVYFCEGRVVGGGEPSFVLAIVQVK